MSLRRPLRLPILLAIVMIVLLVVLTVGWVGLSVSGALVHASLAGLYWAMLPIGTTFIALLVVGVVVYLVLSIKTINLNRRQVELYRRSDSRAQVANCLDEAVPADLEPAPGGPARNRPTSTDSCSKTWSGWTI